MPKATNQKKESDVREMEFLLNIKKIEMLEQQIVILEKKINMIEELTGKKVDSIEKLVHSNEKYDVNEFYSKLMVLMSKDKMKEETVDEDKQKSTVIDPSFIEDENEKSKSIQSTAQEQDVKNMYSIFSLLRRRSIM
jgi:hypothetical protein